MNKFLIQNIHLTSDIHDFFIYPLSIFSCQLAVKKLDVYLSWAKFSSIYFSDVDLSWAKFRSSLVDIKIRHKQSKLVSANQGRCFIGVI